MKFKYQKQPDYTKSNRVWVSRPYIQVRLSRKDRHYNVYALVDSGADVCLFHISIAEVLGIDALTGDKQLFNGIEGKGGVDVYFHSIKLQVIGGSQEITVKAGFVNSNSVGAILGQEDFFENYHITFKRDKEVLEIKEVGKTKKKKGKK